MNALPGLKAKWNMGWVRYFRRVDTKEGVGQDQRDFLGAGIGKHLVGRKQFGAGHVLNPERNMG